MKKKRKPINWDKISEKIKDGFDSLSSGGSKMMDIATKAGVAYVGFNALKHPAGALTGLVALRLAESPNLAAGASGIATLTALGALSTLPPIPQDGFDPCPLPPTAYINGLSMIIALIQRSICMTNYLSKTTGPGVAPTYLPPQGGGGSATVER